MTDIEEQVRKVLQEEASRIVPPPRRPRTTLRRARRHTAVMAGVTAVAVGLATFGAVAGLNTLRGLGDGSKPRPAAPSLQPSVQDTFFVQGELGPIVAAASFLWAVDAEGNLLRIDPVATGGHSVGSMPIDGVLAMAAAPGRLWMVGSSPIFVGDGGGIGVTSIGADATAFTSIPLRGVGYTPAVDLAVGEGAVWAAAWPNYGRTSGTLFRIDPSTMRVERRTIGTHAGGVAAGEGGVWVTDSPLRSLGSLLRIDPATGNVAGSTAVGGQPTAVATGFGSVWVANSGDGTVSRVDPGTGLVAATVSVPGAFDIAAGAGGVWVSDASAGTVSLIDPATNAGVGAPLPGGRWLTTGFGSIWASGNLGRITRMSATGAVAATTPFLQATVPVGARACAADDVKGVDQTQGAAGSREGSLVLRLSWDTTCRLQGRPSSVSIVGSDGTVLAVQARHVAPQWQVDGSFAPAGWPEVVLRSDAPSAQIRVRWTNECSPQVTGLKWRVVLPAGPAPVEFPVAAIPPCLGPGSPSALETGPFEP